VTERVQYVPVHQFNLTAKYLVPVVNATVNMTALYVGQAWGQLPTPANPGNMTIATGDYFVVNARVSKTLWKGVEAYFAVNNLFDKDYQPEIDFPAPGRNMFLGLKASY
jgi:iron complex outermembrane recepter protein